MADGSSPAARGHCRRLHASLPESGEVWWKPPTLPLPEPAAPAVAGPAGAKRGFSDTMMQPQNRFQQIIQDMERKYATCRPLQAIPAGGKSKRARAAAAKGEEAGTAGGGEEGGDAEMGDAESGDDEKALGVNQEEEEGDDGDASSDGSWCTSQRLQDDFIDDTEVLYQLHTYI